MLNELCLSPTMHTWPCSAAWRTMTVSLLAMMVLRMEMTTMGNTKDMKVLICGEKETSCRTRWLGRLVYWRARQTQAPIPAWSACCSQPRATGGLQPLPPSAQGLGPEDKVIPCESPQPGII